MGEETYHGSVPGSRLVHQKLIIPAQHLPKEIRKKKASYVPDSLQKVKHIMWPEVPDSFSSVVHNNNYALHYYIIVINWQTC